MQISYLIFRYKMKIHGTLLPRSAEKITGSNVFKIGGNVHRNFVYCMKLILTKYMPKNSEKLEKYPKNCQIKCKNAGP